jgi:serine/threonine protein kinase
MTPERWNRVKCVLQEALEITPEQRPAFLDRACSTDHSLRREVESLLSSSNEVRSSFMKSSAEAGLRLSRSTMLGDFEILSLVGAGGMGEVYRARDRRLDRDVAIKVLPRFVSFDLERLSRFEQEAKAAAALNHPNILAVFQMGTYEGAPYLVSELLEGETLRDQVKHGSIAPKKAIDYGIQIAHGLAAAHGKGIIHRDLKPENLFVTSDGRIKILDFGLAKLTHAESETQVTKQTFDTEPGAVLGTVGYMSPEQVRGQAADNRSDIFAFGAILYEMLSGKRAFERETKADTMNAILSEESTSLSRVAPNISRALARVVHRCMEKNPGQRFQSVSDLFSVLPALAEAQSFASAPLLHIRKATLRAMSMVAILLASLAVILGLNLGGLRGRLFRPYSPTASRGVPTRSSPITPSHPVSLINHPLVPDTIAPGGPAFTLTVNGSGFVSDSVVNWNGSRRSTTFVSTSQVKASILASDIANAGTASVTVVNPKPGGGPSNAVSFSFNGVGYSLHLNRTEFYAGLEPDSVAVGDFNGDGKLDLAVANSGGGTVCILLGKGDGTFQPPVHYAVGQGPFSQVAVGDFNGDGELDLVVSNFGSNNVSVLLGNGDGTFQAASSYNVGTNPTSVAVADLNGDGKLDLVVSNQNCSHSGGPCVAGTVSVLLGNGDGTFQAHKEYAAGLGPNWVAVGDFNGDGKLDLAVVNGQGPNYTSALLLLLGNGDGTFQAPTKYALKTNGTSVAAADFNRDGKLDLAVVDNIGLVSVFLGNGDGTFRTRVDYPAGFLPYGSIGIGDFNGDGSLDLAVASGGSNSVTILFGNGDGTFQPQGVRFGTGLVPQGVAVGDFNGNGRLDLAIPARYANVVSIMLQ